MIILLCEVELNIIMYFRHAASHITQCHNYEITYGIDTIRPPSLAILNILPTPPTFMHP